MQRGLNIEEFKLDRSEQLIPGMIRHQPLEKFYLDEKSIVKNCHPGTWSNGDGSTFNVRLGPDYKTTGIKAPSNGVLYEIFAFDAYCTKEKKINNISRFYDMPVRPPTPEKYDIPPVLLINVLVPGYEPPFFGKGPTDGKGYSMVFFGELSKSARELLRKHKLSPALKLFQAFIRGGKTGKHNDCLKCIARIVNPEEAIKSYGMMTGLLVSQYNGTPFLARDSPSFYYVPGKYFEIDLDAHLFGKIARKGLGAVKDYIEKVIFDFAFVIEGRTDEENPEQILASIRVSKTGKGKAKQFPFEDKL